MVADTSEIGTSYLAPWLEPEQYHNRQQPEMDSVVAVAIQKLLVTDSPRIAGESPEHLETLAAVQDELPPIIVHQPTMRVIDGIHRLRVAKARGDQEILARIFYGDEADAFVLAVKSNITHGLPLTRADRRAAAIRIVSSHRGWSDRMIASVTGLAPRTVAEIRRRSDDWPGQDGVRIGQDGRLRPVNGATGRILAHQLMTENPGLSLREIAQAAGISPETARNVRKRLEQGQDPVPERIVKNKICDGGSLESRRPDPGDGVDDPGGRLDRVGSVRAPAERLVATLERLKADPALRFTETGRRLLRLLHMQLIETAEWDKICDNVPPHQGIMIANLARECADMWLQLSAQLERNGV